MQYLLCSFFDRTGHKGPKWSKRNISALKHHRATVDDFSERNSKFAYTHNCGCRMFRLVRSLNGPKGDRVNLLLDTPKILFLKWAAETKTLVSIVVSIPACQTWDPGSTPRGGSAFNSFCLKSRTFLVSFTETIHAKYIFIHQILLNGPEVGQSQSY